MADREHECLRHGQTCSADGFCQIEDCGTIVGVGRPVLWSWQQTDLEWLATLMRNASQDDRFTPQQRGQVYEAAEMIDRAARRSP